MIEFHTPEPSDSAGESPQLTALVALVGDVLGSDLVGAYEYGSAVLGGLLPTSDLDLLVVSRRRLRPAERARLVRELLTLSTRPDGEEQARSGTRPIELTIVLESAIRPWRYPPEMEFQYGDWLRDEYVAGSVPSVGPNPDLAVLLEMARRDGRAVAGPAPVHILPPVPWNDLVASMIHGLDGLMQDLEPDTRNVILTLARIWMTLAIGEIRRKDEAAAWAAERLPPEFTAVLERARMMYLDGTYGPWGELEPSIRPTAHHLDSEIHRLAAPTATDMSAVSPEMTASDVQTILDILRPTGADVWIDGGWAVDACLREQTRVHSDLDITIERRHARAVERALRDAGYSDVPRDDTRPWNFVLGDDAGHEVDIHVIEFDKHGRGVYGAPDDGIFYPAGALDGDGTIAGIAVRCTTPEWLVSSHTGYDFDETDWQDVAALCDRFAIPVPDEYRARFGGRLPSDDSAKPE